MGGCRKCNGRGFRESREGFGVDLCGYCDAHALNKAEMAKAAASAAAITRAVDAWREVRAEERREALEEIDTLIDIASTHALGVVLERTLRRAADLLRAAGGGA